MKKLFLLLCFPTHLLFAQETEIDSLKSLLRNANTAADKLELLETITDLYGSLDLQKAVLYASHGIKISEASIKIEWQPQFYEMKGRAFANMLKLDSASFYFEKAVKGYAEIENKKGQATTYFKIGWVHKKRGELQEALEADLKALALMETIQDQMGIVGANERLSEVVLRQGRKEEAMAYAEKAISISENNHFKDELAYALTSAGDVAIAMGDNVQAYRYFDKALKKAQSLGFGPMDLSNFMNNRGNALKRLGRYPEALEQYKNALSIAKQIDYENAIMVIIANLGELNLLSGDYQQALKYQLKSIELQEESGDLSNLPENYLHLSSIYEKLGDYPQALEYQKKSRLMGDSISAVKSDRTMSELLTKYETGKKEATIISQKTKINQQYKTQVLYASLAALFVLIIFGMYFTLKNIRKKRKALAVLNIELIVKNRQNELLLKEIHHRVKNNLEMVKGLLALQSAQLTDKKSKEMMFDSQCRVQSMVIIHQKLYQDSQLDAVEMKDYFMNLSEGVLDAFKADNKVQIECVMDALNLDVDSAVPIGLIVNELLTNALKYAFPVGSQGKINISLKQHNDKLILEFSDNGIGRPKGKKPVGTGFGTQLIGLLTQQLNGKFSERHQLDTSFSFQFTSFKMIA